MRAFALAACLAALSAGTFPARAQATLDPAEQTVRAALARNVEVPKQTEALIQLAWISPDVDPAARALARKTLGEFGQSALAGLADAMKRVKPEQTAEVLRALMEAATRGSVGTPGELLAGLREALWTGSGEARRIAIPELARQQDRLSLLLMIDAVEQDPSLLPVVVPALGEMRDDRARFFLAKILAGGKTGLAEQAATSLSRIGGRALVPLREALRSTNQPLRLTAARAILPVASENDLTALYEYLAAYPADDAATVAAIKAACATIEAAVEGRRSAEAASAPQDF